MREELNRHEPNKWFHSRVYEDVEVAIAVGHPLDFWELPENVQARLIARFRARGTRDAYEAMLRDLEAKNNRKKRENRPTQAGRR